MTAVTAPASSRQFWLAVIVPAIFGVLDHIKTVAESRSPLRHPESTKPKEP